MILELEVYLWCWLQDWLIDYYDPMFKVILFSPEFNK